MKSIGSMPLLVAAAILSGLIAIVSQLGHYKLISLWTHQIAGYSTFGLNAVIVVLGLWTRDRAAWTAYLIVSVLAFVLISAATPLSGLWILWVVIFHTLSHG